MPAVFLHTEDVFQLECWGTKYWVFVIKTCDHTFFKHKQKCSTHSISHQYDQKPKRMKIIADVHRYIGQWEVSTQEMDRDT